jgi:hypothetical protein
VAVAGALAVFALAKERPRLAFVRVALGGGSFALLVSPSFVLAGPSHLREVFAYSVASVSTNPSRLSLLWSEFLRQHTELPTAYLTVIVFVALARLRPVLVLPLLPLLPLLAQGASMTDTLASMAYVTSFGLLGPLFALALRDTHAAWVLIWSAWFPSALAGALTAWSSGNGAIAAAIGLFPAAMVSGILLALWVHEITQPLAAGWPRAFSGYSPLVLLGVMLKLLLLKDAVYRDSDLPELTAEVTDGPYKGLLTTPERRRLLAARSTDILQYARSGRALFYYNFPAGYLISAQRPLVASAWVFAFEPRVSIDAGLLQRKAASGDLIFRLSQDWSGPADPLDRIVRTRATEVLHRDDYRISIMR